MIRGVRALLWVLVGAGMITAVQAQAQAAKDRDPPFKMDCVSKSTKFLPKGNAAAGSVKFSVEVDPAAQSVSVEGAKRPGKVDKFEIWFEAATGNIVSISRTTKTFRVVSPIKDGSDSRRYLLHEGACTIS